MEILIPVVSYLCIGLAFKRFVDRHAPPNEDMTIVWAWPLWVLWYGEVYIVAFVKFLWKKLIESISLPGTRKIKYHNEQGYSLTHCPYTGSFTHWGRSYSKTASHVGGDVCRLCVHNNLTTKTHVLCSYEYDNR